METADTGGSTEAVSASYGRKHTGPPGTRGLWQGGSSDPSKKVGL